MNTKTSLNIQRHRGLPPPKGRSNSRIIRIFGVTMLIGTALLARKGFALTTVSRIQKRCIQTSSSPLVYHRTSSPGFSMFAFVGGGGIGICPLRSSRQLHHFCKPYYFRRRDMIQKTTTSSTMSMTNTASMCKNTNTPHLKLNNEAEKIENEKNIRQLSSKNWKEHPLLNKTYHVPSLSIPADQVHFLVSNVNSPLEKQHLASDIEEWKDVHPKIKIVRNFPEEEEEGKKGKKRKMILLNPHTVLATASTIPQSSSLNNPPDDDDLQHAFPNLPPKTIQTLTAISAKPGPTIPIQLSYKHLSVSKILSLLLPPSAQPPPVGYEQIGHVAHYNLKEKHLPYKHLIANVVLSKVGSIKTVVNKVGEVGGPFRTYDMEFIGDDDNDDEYTPQAKTNSDNGSSKTFVDVVEHGINLQFDIQKVYWCTRLSGDRLTMIQQEFFPPSISPSKKNVVIADAFCGVGALLIETLHKHPDDDAVQMIYANDLNPDAVHYCLENAKNNGIPREKIHVECGDAWDFIVGLGMKERLPDHLVMNYPLDAPRFLDALRWWPCGHDEEEEEKEEREYYEEDYEDSEEYYYDEECEEEENVVERKQEDDNAISNNKNDQVVPTIHVYTFARGDDDNNGDNDSQDKSQNNEEDNKKDNNEQHNNPPLPPRSAAQVAIDLVAQGLLPEGGASEMTKYRGDFLNRLGCDIRTREVRDVAPGKVVICVSFKATKKLLRHIQGDFVDF